MGIDTRLEEPLDLAALREPVPIERVEFRVQSISLSGWATLLAYKDARVDMDRLDTVAPGRWARSQCVLDGQLFCRVGIYMNEELGWVWREDVGTASNTEKEKGRASDAFKRACTNWGSGRDLYDYPLILVKLMENEFQIKQEGQKQKAFATYDLQLKDWVWHLERSPEADEFGRHVITSLSAVDQNGSPRFRYPRNPAQQSYSGRPPEQASQQAPQQAPRQASQQRQPEQRPNTTQRQQGSGGEKPWYNGMKEALPELQKRVDNGEAPGQILSELLGQYKLNKRDRQAIEDLKPQRAAPASASAPEQAQPQNFDFPDDDIPF